MDTTEFRAFIGSETQGLRRFHTRSDFDESQWAILAEHIHYLPGDFEDVGHYRKLDTALARLDAEYETAGNYLFYLATAPAYFGTVSDRLFEAGFQQGPGWRRIVVGKPFGFDFASAQPLNQQLLHNWDEHQIYRIDHYLGKETVQNLLAFRFSNGMFVPLWNSDFIDNWRWSGVPIYVRTGKALCKRSTEIVVQFKCPPLSLFQGTSIEHLSANRLVFHIQPYQGIELLFQAKIPGQVMQLQTVDMRFSYGDIFRATQSTGYETLIHACMHGVATLFSRGDLVESAWKIVQPVLDHWRTTDVPDFPNYSR